MTQAAAPPSLTGRRVLLIVALAPLALVLAWVALCLLVVASPIVAPLAVGASIVLAVARPKRGTRSGHAARKRAPVRRHPSARTPKLRTR